MLSWRGDPFNLGPRAFPSCGVPCKPPSRGADAFNITTRRDSLRITGALHLRTEDDKRSRYLCIGGSDGLGWGGRVYFCLVLGKSENQGHRGTGDWKRPMAGPSGTGPSVIHYCNFEQLVGTGLGWFVCSHWCFRLGVAF